MKKSVLILAMIATTMVSCSKDEITEFKSGERISFRSDEMTRGTVPFNYSSFILGGAFYGADNKMLMKDVTFTQVDGTNSYTSTNAAYWPADGSEVSFYAYAPEFMKSFNGSEPTVTVGTASFSFTSSEKKLKGFDQPTYALNHVDFVTATATGSKESSANGVALTFKHQLAKIEIQAKQPTRSNYYFHVIGVRFCHVGCQADFDFTANDGIGRWSDCQNTRTYETTFPNMPRQYRIILSSAYKSIMDSRYDNSGDTNFGQGDWMLIPQQLNNVWDPNTDKTNSKGGAYIAIYAQISTSNDYYDSGSHLFPSPDVANYEWIAIPIPAVEWQAGMKYTYQIDFSNGFGYVDPEKTVTETDPFKPGELILGLCPKITVRSEALGWETPDNPANEETPSL